MRLLFLISFFILFIHFLGMSQTSDTIYFNKSWKPCNKKEYAYYRLIVKSDSIYTINDYYNGGILQMKATAISLEPEIFEGSCYYYYLNGNVESFGKYLKGKRVGIWLFYNDKGDIIKTYDYNLSIESYNQSVNYYKKNASELDKKFSIALRGKIAGFVIIEDNYFSTATIGTELLFKGRHSLGIDYTYFGWQYEHDNTEDEALYETYERRSYMYVDYKCRLFSCKIFDLYFNMYDKYGTYYMWQEGVATGYNTWEKPWLADKTDGTFNQVGAGLGAKVYLSDRFYIEASANGGKLFSDNNAISHDSLGVATQQFHLKSEKNIFYIRVNLGYKLFVKMKKNEDIFYTN